MFKRENYLQQLVDGMGNGMVKTRERTDSGKQERKRLEIDFVANQGSQRYYILTA